MTQQATSQEQTIETCATHWYARTVVSAVIAIDSAYVLGVISKNPELIGKVQQ